MRRSDVQFKAKAEPADSALFDEAPVVAEGDIIPPSWLELPSAPLPIEPASYPYDGQAVWLTPNGKDMMKGVWRVTRSYNPLKVQWVYEAYWAQHNAGGQRLGFDPVGYKKSED
jgi:hypothetical protein